MDARIAAALFAAYAINGQWAFRCQSVGRGLLLLTRDSAAAHHDLFTSIMPTQYIASVWLGRALGAGAVVTAWHAWRWYGIAAIAIYSFVVAPVLDMMSPWPRYASLLRLIRRRMLADGADAAELLPAIDHIEQQLREGLRFEAITTGVWFSRASAAGAVHARKASSASSVASDPLDADATDPTQHTGPSGAASANVPPLTVKEALATIISALREIDVRLSGDDSPLGDPWEEIKDQVQNEPSMYWDAYRDTMDQYVAGFVASLSDGDVAVLGAALKCSSPEAISRRLLQRLLSKAKKEPIRYEPFDFEYFCYPLLDFIAYGHVVKRTGFDRFQGRVFSVAAPSGELGVIDCSSIESTLSREEFEQARARGWSSARMKSEQAQSAR